MDIQRYVVIGTVLDIITGYCMFWLCEVLVFSELSSFPCLYLLCGSSGQPQISLIEKEYLNFQEIVEGW